MPRYFFHIRRRDDFEADLEGVTFETLDDARADAKDSIREIVADELRAGRPSDITGLEIADNQGDVVAVVTIDEAVFRPLGEEPHPVDQSNSP